MEIKNINRYEGYTEIVFRSPALTPDITRSLLDRLPECENIDWSTVISFGIHEPVKWNASCGVSFDAFLNNIARVNGEVISIIGSYEGVRLTVFMIIDGGSTFDIRFDSADEDLLDSAQAYMLSRLSA